MVSTVVSGLAFVCLGSGVALAQEEESEEPNLLPVETFTCDYNDGKEAGDLQEVIDDWNDFMDDKGVDYYFAATLTPYYFGELLFDVGWLGAWTDGSKMGAGTDMWLGEGGELSGRFGEVLNCTSHTNFVAMNVKQGPQDEDESDKSFVMTFSNCSMKEGKTFDDYLAAQEEWNAYQDEHGFSDSAWAMFPIFGESDDSYDFKSVGTNDDHTAFGNDYKLMSEGHWRKSSELFDDLLDCDIARLYNAEVVREITADEDD
ncbi:MAG: hypothetical protein OEU36_24650 [Gammaproteobacteria bacterium]|nr:hypothetical protein [Gammaproteobacteria bacterium]